MMGGGILCLKNSSKLSDSLQTKKVSRWARFCTSARSFYGQISYAIPPFILFVSVLVFTYFGNQVIFGFNGGMGGSDYPHIPLDDKIPLVSWFVYPYFLAFPLGIVAFFYLAYANKKAFFVMYRTLIISFAISGIIYLFWQTYFTKPDFVPVTFTDKMVVGTWGTTYPINCFPSQHAFMAFGIIIGCLTGGKKMNLWFKIFSIVVAIMVVLATFFIKQHFFLDWVASLGIMLVVYFGVWLWYHFKEKRL